MEQAPDHRADKEPGGQFQHQDPEIGCKSHHKYVIERLSLYHYQVSGPLTAVASGYGSMNRDYEAFVVTIDAK